MWRARRRRDPCCGAGGDSAVPKCPSVAAHSTQQPRCDRCHHELGHESGTCGAISSLRSVSPTSRMSHPERVYECFKCKPTRTGCVQWPPVTSGPRVTPLSDGEVTRDTPAPSGTAPWPVSGDQAGASTAAGAASAPDVGSAPASPRRSGSAAGPGGSVRAVTAPTPLERGFPRDACPTKAEPRPHQTLSVSPHSVGQSSGGPRGQACDMATYTGVGACPCAPKATEQDVGRNQDRT